MVKQKRKKVGWSIFWCPVCKTYQERSGQCHNCEYGETIKKVVKTLPEYCQLLGSHIFKQVGQTTSIRTKASEPPGTPPSWPWQDDVYCFIVVERCIRCKKKKTRSIIDQVSPQKAWGEQL